MNQYHILDLLNDRATYGLVLIATKQQSRTVCNFSLFIFQLNSLVSVESDSFGATSVRAHHSLSALDC